MRASDIERETRFRPRAAEPSDHLFTLENGHLVAQILEQAGQCNTRETATQYS
ncbi:hypothetical protein MBOURGENBZM_14530 [Methanoculleus bourgensis]|nr:hypothetical protein MBOURGENBZM_14530 [Methanoculleus bourgensis]